MGQNDKQRKRVVTCRAKNEKSDRRKNNNTTWENKPENTGEKRKIKKILTKGKIIQTKQDISKERKEILPTRDDTKTYQQPDARESEQFWTKIWQPRKHKKAEWMSNNTKELAGLKKGPKAEIRIDLLQTTLKSIKLVNMDSGSRNAPPFTTDYTWNEQKPTKRTHTWMDDQKKCHIDPEGPCQGNCREQLQIHNLPTDNVENIIGTNKGRDLLLANKPGIVSWRTERMLQRIQWHIRVTLHTSAHPQREQDQTEKSSYGPKISEVMNLIEKNMNTRKVWLTVGGRA